MSDLPSPQEARKALQAAMAELIDWHREAEAESCCGRVATETTAKMDESWQALLASADLMVEAAVKAERERCAKTVEGGHWFPAQTDLARRIRDSL